MRPKTPLEVQEGSKAIASSHSAKSTVAQSNRRGLFHAETVSGTHETVTLLRLGKILMS